MASSLEFAAVSGRQTYSYAALDHLDVAHLSVTIDGSPATVTFDETRRLVTLTDPLTGGEAIVIARTTPITEAGRLVDFLAVPDGTAGLKAADLNTDARQLMLAAEEAKDHGSEAATPEDGMGLSGGQWDGESLRIEGLGLAVDDTDAVRKDQADNAENLSPRELPTVTGADNDDTLFVVAGEFADRVPAEARVHLGLGTAALENAGVAANEVLKLNGSGQYPGNDGQLVDLSGHPLVAAINRRVLTRSVHLRKSATGALANLNSATWYESANSRISLQPAGPAIRTDLDDPDTEVDSNFTGVNSRIDLAAGTWRMELYARFTNTSISADREFGFRIADTTDSAAQVAHIDFGNLIIAKTKSASVAGPTKVLHATKLFKFSALTGITIRGRSVVSGAVNLDHLVVLFNKVSDSF